MLNIIQIIPADGWLAAYTEDDGATVYSPLVGWAIVEDGCHRAVAGLDTGEDGVVSVCDESRNFTRYVRAADIEATR